MLTMGPLPQKLPKDKQNKANPEVRLKGAAPLAGVRRWSADFQSAWRMCVSPKPIANRRSGGGVKIRPEAVGRMFSRSDAFDPGSAGRWPAVFGEPPNTSDEERLGTGRLLKQ